MNIREATHEDKAGVRAVHLAAFPEGEREVISELAVNLLLEQTFPPTISLVAEIDGSLVGSLVLSPVTISNNLMQAYILAPLGVKPENQHQKIGSKLIKSGIKMLREAGVHVLFVYGDPAYYSRFGFDVDIGEKFTPPYPLEHPFGWQAASLNEADELKLPAVLSCVTPLSDPGFW